MTAAEAFSRILTSRVISFDNLRRRNVEQAGCTEISFSTGCDEEFWKHTFLRSPDDR
jgi:hypothetical protein